MPCLCVQIRAAEAAGNDSKDHLLLLGYPLASLTDTWELPVSTASSWLEF